VVTETALAFMLAAGAGLMVRTLSGLLEVRPGLAAPERVLVADLDLPQARYPDQRIWAFAQQLAQRLSAVPGMAGSALMTSVPLDSRSREEHAFELEGGDELPPGQSPRAEVVFATPGYLAVLGVPLRSGRDIRWSDVMRSPHVLLVNEEFVRRYLPRGEPVGRRIKQILGPDNPWDIVGVFGDVRTKGLDAAPVPMVVVPVLQWARGRSCEWPSGAWRVTRCSCWRHCAPRCSRSTGTSRSPGPRCSRPWSPTRSATGGFRRRC
jgi:hypothetical protein